MQKTVTVCDVCEDPMRQPTAHYIVTYPDDRGTIEADLCREDALLLDTFAQTLVTGPLEPVRAPAGKAGTSGSVTPIKGSRGPVSKAAAGKKAAAKKKATKRTPVKRGRAGTTPLMTMDEIDRELGRK